MTFNFQIWDDSLIIDSSTTYNFLYLNNAHLLMNTFSAILKQTTIRTDPMYSVWSSYQDSLSLYVQKWVTWTAALHSSSLVRKAYFLVHRRESSRQKNSESEFEIK